MGRTLVLTSLLICWRYCGSTFLRFELNTFIFTFKSYIYMSVSLSVDLARQHAVSPG